VHLPVGIRAIPFISHHQSLWIGSTSADVGDALIGEQVEGNLVVEQVRHKELLSSLVVDPGPGPSIITSLPSILQGLGLKVAHLVVKLLRFIF
jgi:hypothetical protein